MPTNAPLLRRRTNWNHSDWLPVLAASPVREPAMR